MNDKAKEIYKRAYQLFINYQVNYPENQPIYDRARDFLEQEVEK